jgi:protein gp37
MNRTKIEWVKNPDGTQGYTWNPITGCLNHVNGMCKGGNFPCYAYRLAHGLLKKKYQSNHNVAEPILPLGDYPRFDPFYLRFWPDRLAELQRGMDDFDYERYVRQVGKGIFVCDMSDLFGIGIPEDWTKQVLDTIADDANTIHRFYLLTKQPQSK